MDQRVLDPRLSGYIRKEKLEKLLKEKFGGKTEDFEVRHIRSRFLYKASRELTEDELEAFQIKTALSPGIARKSPMSTIATMFDEKVSSAVNVEVREEQWREYATDSNPMLNNVEGVMKQLRESRSKLFCSPEKMHVDIVDILEGKEIEASAKDSARVCNAAFHDFNSLEHFLNSSSQPRTRFISICSPSSIKPMKISEDAMLKVLTHHHVGPEFLDLLFTFATGSKDSEAGPGSMIFKTKSDGSYEMQYRLSYVEEHSRPNSKSWVIRQMGVYHRFYPHSGRSLWIFLHPKPDSLVQQRLETTITRWEQSGASLESWYLVHLLVLSSYFDDWRWYLKSLSTQIETIAGVALSLDFSNEEHYSTGFNTLQDLHDLQDKVLPLSARLRSSLATVVCLKEINQIFREKGLLEVDELDQMTNEARSYETRMHGHLASVELLEKRVQEILKLLGVALNLKNQATAVKINQNILSLTRDTVDDSATVRVVTVVTLVYLPVSFVSSFLGMNLFVFDNGSGAGFTVSRQFWVFIIIAFPLTLITLGSWFLMSRRRKRQKLNERAKGLLGDGQGKQEV